MADILTKARPLNLILWEDALKSGSVDTPERRAGLEAKVMELASLIQDRTVRQHYERFFRDQLWALSRGERPKPHFEQKGRSGTSQRVQRLVRRGQDGRLQGVGKPQIRAPGYAFEAQMILTLVNHPSLLEEFAERLSLLSFSDATLDKLKLTLLMHLDQWAGLDCEGARRYLIESGYTKELGALESGGALICLSAIAPDSPVEAARSQWETAYRHYTEKALSLELREAEKRLGADLSEESLSYFAALQATQGQEIDPD